MFDDPLKRPPQERSNLHVYHAYLKNRQQPFTDPHELYTFLERGQRPVFGIPHLMFREKRPKTAQDFEQQSKYNWKLMSKSVLK